MSKINPYLTFLGNCEEAFEHYKSVFNGEITMLSRFSEMPPQEGVTIPESVQEKIMHITLTIDEDTILMGSDTGGEWAPKTIVGNNFSLSITAGSKEQADDYFSRLSEGGKVTMPMEKTFWGEYFGMCTDKYDINWMISLREDPKS